MGERGKAHAAGPTTRFSRELGLTHREFLRALPGALGHGRYSVHPGRITVQDRHGEVVLRLEPERERAVGALRLPVTRVEFTFAGHTPQQLRAFMDRFELYLHRGGG